MVNAGEKPSVHLTKDPGLYAVIAKFLELRATVSKARFLVDHGLREKARNLLAPVYGSFSEGFDTVDLREARSLLNEPR